MKKTGSRIDSSAKKSAKSTKGGERRENGGRKRMKTRYIVLLSLTAVILSLFAYYKLTVVPPPQDDDISPPRDNEVAEGLDGDETDLPEGYTRPSFEPLTKRKETYTVLIAGTNDGYNTDTIMVATYDRSEKKVNVISIPRDTVTVYGGKIIKINSIFGRNDGGDKGAAALKSNAGNILGFVPGNYVMVNEKGLEKLVDTIDGVKFNVPMNMYKPSENINLKKGEQVLSGKQAVQLMRFRGYGSNNSAGLPNDDYGRMKVQQDFLKAIFKQMIELKNLTKINEYVKIASEYIKPTDLELGNMMWFAQELSGVSAENISFSTLPTKSVVVNGGYYDNVIASEAIKMLNETVNPYTEPITLEMCTWPQK